MTWVGGSRARLDAGAAAGAIVALALVGCAASHDRDAVSASKDVVSSSPAAGPSAGYDYVARRPHAVVGLAEARGIESGIARAAVDHLADAVERCVDDAQTRGSPSDGAARVVAQVDAAGAVDNATIRVDPTSGTAAMGVLCFLAPTRLLNFPVADRGDRGFAVEALWGSAVGH